MYSKSSVFEDITVQYYYVSFAFQPKLNVTKHFHGSLFFYPCTVLRGRPVHIIVHHT